MAHTYKLVADVFDDESEDFAIVVLLHKALFSPENLYLGIAYRAHL